MNTFMVERYLPGVTAVQLEEAVAQLAAAAAQLAANGVEVRYISSTFIPEEESCLCKFEATDPNDVRRACDAAGVRFARVVETHDLSPKTEEQ